MIAAEYTEWLALVRDIPEADLPSNSSTVAYAVRVAVLLADELEQAHAAIRDLLDHVCEDFG